MATKRSGHQGSPNPPGYVHPGRRGKRGFLVYLTPEEFNALTNRAAEDGKTKQEAAAQLLRDYANGKLTLAGPAPASGTLTRIRTSELDRTITRYGPR